MGNTYTKVRSLEYSSSSTKSRCAQHREEATIVHAIVPIHRAIATLHVHLRNCAISLYCICACQCVSVKSKPVECQPWLRACREWHAGVTDSIGHRLQLPN